MESIKHAVRNFLIAVRAVARRYSISSSTRWNFIAAVFVQVILAATFAAFGKNYTGIVSVGMAGVIGGWPETALFSRSAPGVNDPPSPGKVGHSAGTLLNNIPW